MAVVRLLLLAFGLAVGLTLALGLPALAHAQLVSSSPGAGSVLVTGPAEVRLVFSEPVDPAYSSLDLLDSEGHALAAGVGRPDPGDPRQLVAPLPPVADGAYTISWRAISAADGHSTDGFLPFAVGNAAPPAAGTSGGAIPGDVHGGHGITLAILESAARSVGILGFMAAAGLAIFGWIIRSCAAPVPVRIVEAQAVALLAGAAGAILLAYTVAAGAGGAVPDVVQYLAAGRNGQLLLVRFAIAMAGFLAVLVLVLRERPRLSVGFAAGVAGIVLNAAAGHAAAFSSAVPILNQVVHVGAASAWIGGLLGFGVLFLLGVRPLPPLGKVIPRFSAVGLVSVALIALTGAYADWIQTRDPLSIGSQYQFVLAVKIVLFLVAVAIGGLNFLRATEEHRAPGAPTDAGAGGGDGEAGDDGRGRVPGIRGRIADRFGFRQRVLVEAAFAVTVIGASGLLASGSPPGGVRPLDVSPAVSSAVSQFPAALSLLPGRAGPNQLIVTAGSVPAGDAVSLVLQRLDQSAGPARFPLHLDTAGRGVANGVTLLAGSRWDATVVLATAAGNELARARFVYAVGVDGLSEGELAPPVDPVVALALLLLLGAALGVSFSVAGGALPRTDPRWSRITVAIGSTAAGILGAGMLLLGGSVR